MIRPILTRPRLLAAIRTTHEIFGADMATLLGRSRTAGVSRARHACITALYQACSTGLAQLGTAFDRDHTTILNSVQQGKRLATLDPDFAAAVERIAAAVKETRER